MHLSALIQESVLANADDRDQYSITAKCYGLVEPMLACSLI